MIVEEPRSQTQPSAAREPAYGSDVVVELLHRLGIEYAAFNPGASFRGLHDSFVNYGGDTQPRTVLCTHEEISVALAHGYAKATGRPMVAALHDVVGLQHACMAIFNAWCDRVPILLLGGTGPMDAPKRRPWIEWIHTAMIQGNHVRDFVKWDDQPASPAAAVESILRAYRLMTAEPSGPVYICLDAGLQEDPLAGEVAVPAATDLARWVEQAPVQADPAGLRTAAEWLSASRRPLILADTVGRSAEGFAALRAFAERLSAPVVDLGSRLNVPTNHPLQATDSAADLLIDADVILAVDVVDLWGALQSNAGRQRPAGYAPPPDTRLISLSLSDLLVHSWTADYQRLQAVDLRLVGDSRIALPALQAALTSDPVAERERAARADALADASRTRRATVERETAAQAHSPTISPAYLALALRNALAGHSVVLSNSDLRGWVRRLWTLDEPFQHTGGAGGAGLGYGIGASLGVALAHAGTGKIVVDIQPDGDLLYCSSALWTAAREQLPLLIVMWNNRSYYNSEEHAVRVAEQRDRPVERAGIGTQPVGPNVDFATVARGFGLGSAGPVTTPEDLPAALARAVEVVATGRPYLLDVVTTAR